MHGVKAADYAREANKLGITIVDFLDKKKDVTNYFTGQGNETMEIDTARRAQTLIRKSDIRQGTALES